MIRKFLLCALLAAVSSCAGGGQLRAQKDIAGVWTQYMRVENAGYICGGTFKVEERDGVYSMYQLPEDGEARHALYDNGIEVEVIPTSGLFNVRFDGGRWSFDSRWAIGVGHFELDRVTDNLYEGYSFLDGEKRSFNRWERTAE